MKKRALSMVLALVLAFGLLAVPAGAVKLDAYGRNYERVVGGTYYAEQTANYVWTCRIFNYECPKMSGNKHNVVWHPYEPTCTEGDSSYNYCSWCGEKEILREVGPLGHDYQNGVCTRCGETDSSYTAASSGSGGIGTGNQPSTATGTGSAETGTGAGSGSESHNHQWYFDRDLATCTQEGRWYKTCKICGVVEVLDTTPKTAHAYQATITRAATATQEGIRTYTCRVCGESYTESIPKLSGNSTGVGTGTGTGTGTGAEATCQHGTTPSYWTYNTVKPTCQAEGRSYRVCKVCGAEETLATTPKTAHTWEQKTVQATTREDGKVYRVCKVCGAEEVLSTLPAKLHNGSGSTAMAKLSQQEIERLLESAPNTYSGDLFDKTPSLTSPYSAGKVKASALQATVDRLNALRRIAGLPAVSLDSSLTEKTQYGAVVIAANGKLSHTPSKPSGMDDSFYKIGYNATSSSNLAAGSGLVGAIDSWMDDSDASNIARVGHRRWQLNPIMGKTGFGYARSGSGYGSYAVEWSFDQSGSGCPYDYIAWPASGNFPSSLFNKNEAWSASLNPEIYAAPSQSAISISITRQSDGKVWRLSGSYAPAASGAYLNVIPSDSYNYGANHCIIFRPAGIESYDGTYSVTISGLKYKDGSAATLSYDVDFFGNQSKPAQNTAQPGAQQPGQAAGSNPFTDVPEGTYYHDAVLWALENNITTGVTATQFQPNSTCTRGQVVTFLWRAKGCPEPATKGNPFRDVSASSPFYKAILWAYENGITTGTTATTFNPGGTCSNGHVVTFLWRANGKPAAAGSSTLANAYPGGYYTQAVAWADSTGLLTGAGAAFNPSARSPRANIVTYLFRDMT